MPFESRIGRVNFEYFLIKAMPQNIIMINGTATKFNHIKQFIAKNKLETEVKHVANSSFGLISNTATK